MSRKGRNVRVRAHAPAMFVRFIYTVRKYSCDCLPVIAPYPCECRANSSRPRPGGRPLGFDFPGGRSFAIFRRGGEFDLSQFYKLLQGQSLG